MTRVARIKRHMVVDIDGALERVKAKDRFVLTLLQANNFATLKKELEDMKVDGYKVIPNADCDNQGYDGECLGHQTWTDEKD